MEERKKDNLIDNLSIDRRTKLILGRAGYATIADLESSTLENVKKQFQKLKGTEFLYYDAELAFKQVKDLLHRDYHITFKGEYEELGLTSEMAVVPVTTLDLPTGIKNILTKKLDIYTFGELLTTDYQRFLETKKLGDVTIRKLKDYIHGLGYTLKDEEPTLSETLDTLKAKGVKLLEETIQDADIYMPMYRSGIYSIEDLLNNGPNFDKIYGFGPQKQQQLVEKMKELNLTFADNTVDLQKKKQPSAEYQYESTIIVTDSMLEQEEIENAALRKRIKQKEELLSRYENIMAERQKLLAREKELDRLIASKKRNIEKGGKHGKK